MKTIQEQIEVMQHFDDGGLILRIGYINPLESSIFNKASMQCHVFNWTSFDYSIPKEVKPLFPTKKQGAKYIVFANGEIMTTKNYSEMMVSEYAKQGRTFYTLEDAEAFVRREQAKTYCLEAINRVNGGDNGFKVDSVNYYLSMTMNDLKLNYFDTFIQQSLENGMYIRTEETAQELINDAEFVENWHVWKGVSDE